MGLVRNISDLFINNKALGCIGLIKAEFSDFCHIGSLVSIIFPSTDNYITYTLKFLWLARLIFHVYYDCDDKLALVCNEWTPQRLWSVGYSASITYTHLLSATLEPILRDSLVCLQH